MERSGQQQSGPHLRRTSRPLNRGHAPRIPLRMPKPRDNEHIPPAGTGMTEQYSGMTIQTVDRKRRRLTRCIVWAIGVVGCASLTILLFRVYADMWALVGLSMTIAFLAVLHPWMRDPGGIPILLY